MYSLKSQRKFFIFLSSTIVLPTGEIKMREVTAKFSTSLLNKVDELAYSMRVGRAVVLRNAIFQILSNKKIPSKRLSDDVCIMITFKLEDWIVDELNKIAKQYSLSRSEVIRRACYSYLITKGKIKSKKQDEEEQKEEPVIKARVIVTKL